MSPDSSSLLEVTFDRRTTACPVLSNLTLSSSGFHSPFNGGFSRASPSLTPAMTPTWKRSLVLLVVALLRRLSFRLVFRCSAVAFEGLSPPRRILPWLGAQGGLKWELTWREREIWNSMSSSCCSSPLQCCYLSSKALSTSSDDAKEGLGSNVAGDVV